MISSVNSEVESGCPLCMKRARSLVAFPSAKLASSASTIRSAGYCQPRYSSVMTAESINEQGLTTPFPAMLGAVPWVASKMACPES